jgi:uncharacterized protein (TIGR00369 family)
MSELDERLVGWETMTGHDAFEDFCGPMYYKKIDGNYVSRMVLRPEHMNGQDSVHGGVLMTFADYALFMITREELKGISAVTISFNSDFIAPASAGDMIESEGEVVRETGSMLFVRGLVTQGDTTLLRYSGVLKKLRKR